MVERSRKGFTLAEMLVVLAAVAVLSTVAAVSFARIQASLRLSRLDTAAEELFLYAQENLSSASASDESVSEVLEGLSYIAFDADSEGPVISALGLDGVTALLNIRSAVIEFDAFSGDVLFALVSDELSADEILGAYLSLTDRTEDEIHGMELGSCGYGERSAAPRKYRLEPEITVHNGEELILEITCEGASHDAQITVFLTSEYGGFSETVKPDHVINGTASVSYLVDKTVAGCGSYYIDKFSDSLGVITTVSATARVMCDGEVTAPSAVRRSEVSFDPLFGGTSSPEISSTRHFNNLRFIGDSEISFIQTADIDFSGRDFLPIPQFCGSYDGSGLSLSNISIYAADREFCGVFEMISGSISGVDLRGLDITAENCAYAGAICGSLAENGSISDCSVSEASVKCVSSEGVVCGGIAGVSFGSISRCRSDAYIGINANTADVGGLVGEINGIVSKCRSSGRVSLDGIVGMSRVAGIAAFGSGNAESCYSELSPEYICGAEFSGSGGVEASDCLFLSENAWLDGADGISESEVMALRENISERDEKISDVRDVIAFMSDGEPAEPRGLTGAVKVSYDGSFEVRVLASFDAYGNDSDLCPDISWDSPQFGEERYFWFYSSYAAPEGDYACLTDPSDPLGDEFVCGRYICREIMSFYEGDSATLRFGSQSREIFSDTPEPVESLNEGIVGVAVISYDPFDWQWTGGDRISYHYFETDSFNLHTEQGGEMLKCPEIERPPFGFETDVRIYAFVSESIADSAVIEQELCTDVISETVVDGVVFYELFRSDYFDGESGISITYGDREYFFRVVTEDLMGMFTYQIYSERR